MGLGGGMLERTMMNREQLETILNRVAIEPSERQRLFDELTVYLNGRAPEPQWCDHIERDDVGRQNEWWLLVPFHDITPVGHAWHCCPICAAPRPAAT